MFISRNRKIIKPAICISALCMGAIASCFTVVFSQENKVSDTSSAVVNSSTENTQAENTNKSENKQDNKDQNATASESSETKSTTTDPEDEKRLFMWKAVRGDQTVYLLGTIHAVRSDFYPVPNEIDKALAQSKELFVECLPEREKILAVSKSLHSKYAYKNGDNLFNHLNPTTKKVFDEYLAWAGEPAEIYETFRPFQVSGLISSDAVRRYGLTVPGLDKYLISKAKQANKKVTELESVEFQLNLLSGLSEPEQNAELLSSLLTLQDVAVELDRIIRAWHDGDADLLEKLVTKASRSDSEIKAVDDKVITARNHGMVNKLENCLKEDSKGGTYLVAVGSAHMVGNNGLPALLKEKGFSVSQVSVPKEAPKTSFGSAKLERLFYPEGKFSILLPGPPVVQYGSLAGFRIVNYVYPTFAGSYSIGYFTLPQQLDPGRLNAFYNAIGMGMVGSLTAKLSKISTNDNKNQPGKTQSDKSLPAKALPNKTQSTKIQKSNTANQIKLGGVIQNSMNICNHLGRQMQMELSDPHGDKCLIVVRMVVVDQYLYILTVAGKKVWVTSPIVNEVLNSLSVGVPSKARR